MMDIIKVEEDELYNKYKNIIASEVKSIKQWETGEKFFYKGKEFEIVRKYIDKLKINVNFDETGSIGKRYRRNDEIGTPYCVTIDFDTLNDKCVTIRERDSMKQERISIDKLKDYLLEKTFYR